MRSKGEKKKRKKLRKKLTAKLGGGEIDLDRDVIKSQAEINEEQRLLKLRS